MSGASLKQPDADEALWTVYVLRSTTIQRTYVGIARDPALRLAQHNGEQPGGAKATRPGRPWEIVTTFGPFATRGAAQSAEASVKALKAEARFDWNADD